MEYNHCFLEKGDRKGNGLTHYSCRSCGLETRPGELRKADQDGRVWFCECYAELQEATKVPCNQGWQPIPPGWSRAADQ